MRMTFNDWLTEFLRDKREIPPGNSEKQFAVHTVRRFVDNDGIFWESALTYTGRLVVRSGRSAANHSIIVWNEWRTKHDVALPDISNINPPSWRWHELDGNTALDVSPGGLLDIESNDN